MNFFQQLFGRKEEDISALIKAGAILIDVRTPNEFASGHVKGSINIPLDTINKQLASFHKNENIIVFCRSGNRSSLAKSILQQNGFNNVVNAGTWNYVNKFVQ